MYAAVERYCPGSDVRRKDKPDGSWLPKVGKDYPGAVSFWTERGLERYIGSGLLGWHAAVVRGAIEVCVVDSLRAFYRDPYQAICPLAVVATARRQSLESFMGGRSG